MIILKMPLFAWLGVLLFLCILKQAWLGMEAMKGKKNYFKWHKELALIIIILAIVHLTLALLFLLKGIVI